MIELSCHCGAVHLKLAARPEYLHECNCSMCHKSGARWGYFPPSEVTVAGPTSTYVRTDKADPGALFHFCATCGCTTHFTLSASAIERHGNVVMGVNLRLTEETALAGIELRFPDGVAWNGEGAFDYVREPRLLGG